MKTKLHYTEVLTLSTGYLVAKDGMEGLYRAANAVAGPGITTLALTYVGKPCEEHVRRNHPEYDNPAVDAAVEQICKECKECKTSGKDQFLTLLNERVLPLLPSGEYVEVEHMGEERLDKLMDGYEDHLNKVFKDKEVIVVAD